MFLALTFAVCLCAALAVDPLICANCDQNDYNPVCAEGRAYGNLCKLQREICLGKVVLTNWTYGTCTVLREPQTATKTDDHDTRVIFRFFPTEK